MFSGRRRARGPAVVRAGAVAALLLVLPRCAADVALGEQDGSPRIAAGFYPLAYLAERVAGQHARVDDLTTPGLEPHHAELTVARSALLAEADLVLHAGGMQPAVRDAVAVSGTPSLDATRVVALRPAGQGGHAHEHAPGEHAEEEHTARRHADEEHAEGVPAQPADPDYHFWLDPERAAAVATALAERLAALDPDHATEYRRGAAALVTDLEELDRAYARGLASCRRTTVVVSHDAFGYWEKYGLEFAPVAGLSPGAVPTPAALARLRELITDRGITTVFTERLSSDRTAETVAEEAGVSTAVLDPVAGLTPETRDEDYLSLMRNNLTALRKAGDCR